MIEDKVFERIKCLCDAKQYTMHRLAKESGLPYSSLNNIIHRRTCPTVGTLAKICKGLDITLPEFFDFELYPLKNDGLTEKEDELVNKYRTLSKRKQALLDAYIDGLRQ